MEDDGEECKVGHGREVFLVQGGRSGGRGSWCCELIFDFQMGTSERVNECMHWRVSVWWKWEVWKERGKKRKGEKAVAPLQKSVIRDFVITRHYICAGPMDPNAVLFRRLPCRVQSCFGSDLAFSCCRTCITFCLSSDDERSSMRCRSIFFDEA